MDKWSASKHSDNNKISKTIFREIHKINHSMENITHRSHLIFLEAQSPKQWLPNWIHAFKRFPFPKVSRKHCRRGNHQIMPSRQRSAKDPAANTSFICSFFRFYFILAYSQSSVYAYLLSLRFFSHIGHYRVLRRVPCATQ